MRKAGRICAGHAANDQMRNTFRSGSTRRTLRHSPCLKLFVHPAHNQAALTVRAPVVQARFRVIRLIPGLLFFFLAGVEDPAEKSGHANATINPPFATRAQNSIHDQTLCFERCMSCCAGRIESSRLPATLDVGPPNKTHQSGFQKIPSPCWFLQSSNQFGPHATFSGSLKAINWCLIYQVALSWCIRYLKTWQQQF